MTEEVKSIFDAVSSAIDTADTKPESVKQELVSDDESTVDDRGAGDGDTSADGETDENADAGEVSGDATDTAGKDAGAEANEAADGTAGKEAGKTAAAGAEAEGETKPPVKPLDPVNDPIPNGTAERTRERITSLIGTVKTQAAQLEQSNTLFDTIADTGMEPEQFAQMLNYARARHKGTAESREAAYEFLQTELHALSIELGKTDGIDVLAGHQDLKDAIEANTITEAFAKEIAVNRERAKRTTAATEATNATTTQRTAHAAGVTAMNDIGAALVKRDGADVFKAKQAILKVQLGPTKDAAGNVTHRGLLAQFPPDQWGAVYQRAYDALPKPVIAKPPAAPPKQQPLRSASPAGAAGAGSGKREAKSLKDAVFAAIDGIDD